jgi:L,D-peptidoglycan transpeptidase YkuD (ErfK/YbiS/YcfS/YnhG family)
MGMTNYMLNAAIKLLLVALLISGCAGQPSDSQSSLNGTVITGNQLLFALAESRDSSMVKIYALERTGPGWELHTGPLPGITGRNGFASPGAKREGDGRAPTGLFPLESAFGYAASINSNMQYQQATENDLWVDDVLSLDYNTWVKRGQTSATSFEVMKLADNRYRHGLITGYNRKPVIKGYGSGIFVHTWLEDGYTTSGCVAFDETELIKLLAWLDPTKQPQILMGIRQDLATVAGLPSLPPDTDLPGVLEKQIRRLVNGQGERLVEYRSPDGFFGMAVALPGNPLSHVVLTRWGTDGKPEIGELVVPKEQALQTVKEAARQFNLQRSHTQRNSISNRQPHTD